MGKFYDITGMTFGRLVVVRRVPGSSYKWLCKCSCGVEKEILSASLRKSLTQSCGCLRNERVSLALTKHGECRTPTYTSWQGMIERCENPKNKKYPRYGARGITVCHRWRQSFSAFKSDMGDRPPGMSIERKDNDGHYEPGNCVWGSPTTQARNTSRTKLTLELAAEVRSVLRSGGNISQWARTRGINRQTAYSAATGHTWGSQ